MLMIGQLWRKEIPKKRFSPEQIILKLREVKILVGLGESIANACKKIAVTEQT